MTVDSVSSIMSRIKTAKPSSPIAVFKLTDRERILADDQAKRLKRPKTVAFDAVFAASILVQQRIKKRDKLLVGVFDQRDSQSLVKNRLTRLLRK